MNSQERMHSQNSTYSQDSQDSEGNIDVLKENSGGFHKKRKLRGIGHI
jgi:hypothetical protein